MADMSEILKNFSSMMEVKEIPDNIKEMLSSLQNNSSKSENNSSGQNDSQSIPNIDINTMLKMQKLLNTMNNSSNSSGANLLRSLKPYLKPSRQAKVDEYIQLFSIEKAIELMRQSGGDKKNDT